MNAHSTIVVIVAAKTAGTSPHYLVTVGTASICPHVKSVNTYPRVIDAAKMVDTSLLVLAAKMASTSPYFIVAVEMSGTSPHVIVAVKTAKSLLLCYGHCSYHYYLHGFSVEPFHQLTVCSLSFATKSNSLASSCISLGLVV